MLVDGGKNMALLGIQNTPGDGEKNTIPANEFAAAPDFSLPNIEGNTVHLSDYRGKKHVVLVFNRGFM